MTTETQAPDPALVFVPRDPTPEMVKNALKECGGIGGGSCGEHTGVDADDMRAVWDAMLAAAPIPALEGVGLTDEQIHELIEQHAGYGGDDIRAVVRAAIAAARAQRAAPAPQAAPDPLQELTESGEELDGLTAAYMAGQRAERERERVALTPSQIHDLCNECHLDWHRGWSIDEEPNRYLQLARAIEAAHGIPAPQTKEPTNDR